MSAVKRFAKGLRSVALHWWWIVTSERERVMADNKGLKDRNDELFKLMADYRDALYQLKFEHRGASVDILRQVAVEIDCGNRCDFVSSMDWSTGVTECRRSDYGKCAFENAEQLRALARALEVFATAPTS